MKNTQFLIAAAFGLSLSGCGAMGDNTSMYSVHQPVVERSNYVLDVNAGGSGITGSEKIRVAEWFDALQLGYGDRVSVDYGTSYVNAAARQSVSDLAGSHGLLLVETAPVTPGNIVPGTVRVIVSRSTASVPSCPDWSKTTEANYNSSNHSNYGCAYNSNLAAMVADPEDLVRGQKPKVDGNSGNVAANAHRTKTAGGQ
jgi:pilus assembly protein CpaD